MQRNNNFNRDLHQFTIRNRIEQSNVFGGGGVGVVAQSVERATPGQQVPGSIPAVAARSLLVGSVSV